MGFLVFNGAITNCPFGTAPGTLTVLPIPCSGPEGPFGLCTNCIPFLNIAPFCLCTSLQNPVTAALTAASFGVLTPGACIPTPIGMWSPEKPTVTYMGMPVLDSNSTLLCAFGGSIKIVMPAGFRVMLT